MEFELASKVFLLEDYSNKNDMEEDIKKYIRKLKNDYPMAVVTREFYKGNGVLVRATKIDNKHIESKIEDRENELELEEVRIKEKGINGLGENVYRTEKNGKSREKEIGHGGGNKEGKIMNCFMCKGNLEEKKVNYVVDLEDICVKEI